MRFQDVLRDLRKKAGMTQEALAERSGVPLPSLRGHEQGQRTPSWASVVKLAKALGVSTDAFAGCDEVIEGDAGLPRSGSNRIVAEPEAEPSRPRGRPRKTGSADAAQGEPPAGSTRGEGKPAAKKTRKRKGE